MQLKITDVLLRYTYTCLQNMQLKIYRKCDHHGLPKVQKEGETRKNSDKTNA